MKTTISFLAIVSLAITVALSWAAGAQSSGPAQQTPPARADAQSRSVWDGVYTADQAKRGADISSRECEMCHSDTGDQAPPLSGDSFLAEWDGQNLDGLFEKMRTTMPQTKPGKLARQEYVDLLAHILDLNKFPAGKAELDGQDETLKDVRIEANKPKPKQNSN